MNELKVNFIISESIDRERNLSGGETSIIVNPINVIQTKYIPTQLSFGLTIIISNFEHNIAAQFEISVVHSESGRTAYTTGVNTIPPLDGSVKNFNFNLDLKNVDIEDKGMYTAIFKYQGREYTHEFEVVKIGN